VESSCEFGIEPSGSVKCWETYRVAYQVVLSSIELVSYELPAHASCACRRTHKHVHVCSLSLQISLVLNTKKKNLTIDHQAKPPHSFATKPVNTVKHSKNVKAIKWSCVLQHVQLYNLLCSECVLQPGTETQPHICLICHSYNND
jgi:hypothetical protein